MAAAPPTSIRPRTTLAPRQASTSAAVAAATGTSFLTGDTLHSETSLRLMRKLYLQIPVMRKAINILAGFAGVPNLTGVDDAHTASLRAWAGTPEKGKQSTRGMNPTLVRAGWNGYGLKTWLRDHIGQALWYGYGVAEAEAAPDASDIYRLWSYRSPNFRFQAWDADTLAAYGGGQAFAAGLNIPAPPDAATTPVLQVIQRNSWRGQRVLDPLTSAVSTYDPEGSDPRGQMLFLSCPMVAGVLTTALSAEQATFRRMGIPIFHINWEPEDTFIDGEVTTGELNPATGQPYRESEKYLAEVSANLAAAVKSQVERGQPQDIVTMGKVTIGVVGLDGKETVFTASKRDLMEEIVVASGVPPFLYGYSWALRETMSRVQFDALTSVIDCVRATVEPAARQFVDLRQRLVGETRPYELEWPDISSAELIDTARAALMDAQADVTELDYALGLWREGIWNQEQVAEHCTGSPDVATPMAEPSAPVAAPPPVVAGRAAEQGSVETGAAPAGGGPA